MTDYKNYIAGNWITTKAVIEVNHPYTGEVFATVPACGPTEVDQVLHAAEQGVATAATMSANQRYTVLLKAAELLAARTEEFAQIIMQENGKTINDARLETVRAVEVLRMSAFEGSLLRGDSLPLDVAPNAADKIGLTLRVPCGIVVCICPFNFPLNLALHKVAPALAVGNAVIVKPASTTPLSAIKLVELLHEAGFTGNILQVITGAGSTVGNALVADSRPRKISFTGSKEVGLQLSRHAGIKKLSLELGSNCPLIVMPDADLAEVAQHVALGGYANNGQACTSLQRAIVHKSVYADFIEATTPVVAALPTGDPAGVATKVSTMITEAEATRVSDWLTAAETAGATIATGGERAGALLQPTLVTDVSASMQIATEEIFGPVVATMAVADLDEAIALANATPYGLSAGIFTNNVKDAWYFAKHMHSGSVHINSSPVWRADFMPFGGLKDSGIGKEGMRSTCLEMTEEKTVVFHGNNL